MVFMRSGRFSCRCATAPSVYRGEEVVAHRGLQGSGRGLAWREALSSACATAPCDDGRFLPHRRRPRAEPARLARRRLARSTVLIVHGLGGTRGRYEQVAATLAAQGWQVVAYDQRGHGQSPGPRS